MIDSQQRPAPVRRLADETLAECPPAVAVPSYDRTALTPAIVHFGVGGFHRAHQAVYLDQIAAHGISTAWGEWGVGLHSRAMKDALAPQACLYTVVERSAEEDRARVVGAMGRYLYAPEETEAVLAALTDERTRLITLTITGTGYKVDPNTGTFDADDPEVNADLDHPANPDTVFGYLVEALRRRRERGIPPFSVLSCDNMQDNGAAARTSIVSFADLRDEKLARWIERNVAFPSSMVDRITPATTDADRAFVAHTFAIDDRWPVVTEPFTQWIVQDTFCHGRPPFEEVGVQLVADVTPYERMKTRLLNASHCAIGYLGYLAGYRRTDEAMADPLFRAYITRLMDDEVTPLLPAVSGIDLPHYKRTLIERFANPKIGDQLARLCGRGSTKVPNYLLPSIAEALEGGRPHELLALAVAGWCRYLRGVDDEGKPIEIKDVLKDRLQELARAGTTDPRPLLSEYGVFGDLGENPAFVASLERALRALDRDGPHATLAAYLAAPDISRAA
jgi:mannitol-1-phosphate/altronate dehydrogenase